MSGSPNHLKDVLRPLVTEHKQQVEDLTALQLAKDLEGTTKPRSDQMPGVSKVSVPQFELFQAKIDKTAPTSALKDMPLIRQLEGAYLSKDYIKQCQLLINMADQHLNVSNYADAAKLLNGGLAILSQQYKISNDGEYLIEEARKLENLVLEKLQEIERKFFQEKLKTSPKPQTFGRHYKYKQRLLAIREFVRKGLKEFGESLLMQEVEKMRNFQSFSEQIYQQMRSFIEDIFKDCIAMVGEVPCEYALLGLGSLARQEMTPYSDLECCLLVEIDSSAVKEYFKKVCLLFELRIINLGETDLIKGQNLLPSIMLNPIRKGLSFDVHKNPQQNDGDLVGTPAQLARYQKPEHFVNEPTNHLSLSLLNVTLVGSSQKGQKLLDQYLRETGEILNVVEGTMGQSLRLKCSLATLTEDLDHFRPRLLLKDEGSLLNVKNDFYRLPQTILDSLGLGLDLPSGNTWNRIDVLCSQFFVGDKIAAQRLKWLVSQTHLWRLETYANYNQQKESVDILVRLTESSTKQAQTKGIQAHEIVILKEAYKILIALHDCCVDFYESGGDKKSLREAVLYDDSSYNVALIDARLFQYESALRNLAASLKEAEGKQNLERQARAHHRMSLVYEKLGQGKAALDSGRKSLQLRRTIKPIDKSLLASSANNLATLLLSMGQYQEAIAHFEEALNNNMSVWGEKSPRISTNLSNLGAAWNKFGYVHKALNFFTRAEEINRLNGVVDNELLTNFGIALCEFGKFQEAISCLERVVSNNQKMYGDAHHELAISLCNLAVVRNLAGDFKSTLECFENAVRVISTTRGDKHPDMVRALVRVSDNCRVIGNLNKAIEYLNKALALNKELYDPFHEGTIDIYNKMAAIFIQLHDAQSVKSHAENVLELCREFSSIPPIQKATALSNLGLAHQLSDEFGEAEECFKQALDIMNTVNDAHPVIGILLNNIGATFFRKGSMTKALEYCRRALTFNTKIYANGRHLEIGRTHFNIAGCLQKIQPKEAIRHYQQALQILMEAFGPMHLQVAIVNNNLGLAFFEDNLFDKAQECYEVAIDVHLKMPNQHVELGPLYNNLAGIYSAKGELEKAKKYYELAMEINIKFKGESHSTVGYNANNLGIILMRLSDFSAALKLFERALEILTKCMEEEADIFAVLYNNLAIVQHRLKDINKTKQCFKNA